MEPFHSKLTTRKKIINAVIWIHRIVWYDNLHTQHEKKNMLGILRKLIKKKHRLEIIIFSRKQKNDLKV